MSQTSDQGAGHGYDHDERVPEYVIEIRDYFIEKGLAKSHEEALLHAINIRDILLRAYNKTVWEIR